jgi:predicted DNA-binding antitoxin AbrB/MazE fold protein
MNQIVEAVFEGGVFKPDQKPELAENTRVRLVVEPVEATEESRRRQSWVELERLWKQSAFNSHGDRLSRDQLHERR